MDKPKQVWKYKISREKAPTPQDLGLDKMTDEQWNRALEIIRKYHSEFARKGGLVGGKASTPAKRRAARKNGRLGGRPKGSKNKKETS